MDAIKATEAIIKKQVRRGDTLFHGKLFTKYQRGYLWTNEDIPSYLAYMDFEGKDRALSVASSGDHTFNLIEKGILNVDTFDTNALTEYLAFGLKKAMILKFDYRTFCAISHFFLKDVGIDTLTDTIKAVIPYMDKRYQIYWNAILDYNYKIQREYGTNLNLIQMLTLSDVSAKQFNSFIQSEESYNRLKRNLERANITFRCTNALELGSVFRKNKYDTILLSNIPDYFNEEWGYGWEYKKLREYEKSLEKIVKEGGVIFLEYIFRNFFKDGKILDDSTLIDESRVGLKDIEDEEVYALSCGYSDFKDGIILKRVK